MTTNSESASLLQALKSVESASLGEAERLELILALRAAQLKLETPWQTMQGLVWENSAHAAALKIGKDINLYKAWADSTEPVQDVQSLVKITKSCEEALLDRVLRALAYKGSIDSPSPNKYTLNAFSKALAEPTMGSCLDYWFDFQIPAVLGLPAFVASIGHKFPTDPMSTAWNFATKDPTPFFGYLQQRPEKMFTFASVMQRYSAQQPAWVDMYPAEKLLEGSPSGPILVDIGGSLGHDIVKFLNKYSPPAGSCYLQDKPEVVAQAPVPDAVNKAPLDFFTEVPVKGARAYYLHSVLHDWSDDQCRTILNNIQQAMDKDSKVLIHELVRLEDGSNDLVSLGEFTVMSILGAPERSEQQWRDLVASAGLKVTGIYSNPLSVHSVIEVTS